MGCLVAVWLISYGLVYSAREPGIARFWLGFSYLAVPLIPASILHFTTTVAGVQQRATKWVALTWGVGIIWVLVAQTTDLLLDGVNEYSWRYFTRYGSLGWLFVVFFCGTLCACSVVLLVQHRRALPGSMHRRRLRAYMLGFAVVTFAAVDFIGDFGVAVYPLGFAFVTLFVLLSANATWHYQLFDITAYLRAEDVLETMDEAVVVVDAEGFIRVANRAANRLLGAKDPALLGRHVSEFAGSHLGTEECDSSAKLHGLDTTWRRLDGRDIAVSVSASPVRDRRRGTVGAIYTASDIQELKAAESILIKRLYHAEKMAAVGRLAAGIAHEINNPTGYVLNNLQVLREYSDTLHSLIEQTRTCPLAEGLRGEVDYIAGDLLNVIDDAIDGARRIQGTVLEFRNFAHPGDAPAQPVDLSEAVERALALASAELRFGCRLEVDLEPIATVLGDPRQMVQVFVNLLINAKHALEGSGVIRVRTYQSRGHVYAEVRDDGRGIAPDHLEHVFEPYFTTKGVGEGTGLGLAITHGIVERHGGQITVDSEVGRGTTFVMAFPRADTATLESGTQRASAAPIQTQ